GRGRLRVESRRLPDAAPHLGEHLIVGFGGVAWRGPQRALGPALRRPAVERQLTERRPHATPVRAAVGTPQEGGGAQRGRGTAPSRRRVLAPLRLDVAPQ